MTGLLWATLGVLGGFGLAAAGDMVSEEARDRLDHLPHAILRLAARRIDQAYRMTAYEDEWMPELTYILKGDEARPVTRLYHGTRYALGILIAARRITRPLRLPAPEPPTMEAVQRLVSVMTQRQALHLRLIEARAAIDAAQAARTQALVYGNRQPSELRNTEAVLNSAWVLLARLRGEEAVMDRLIYDEFGYERGLPEISRVAAASK